MKQIVQHLGTGETEIVEAPVPSPGPSELLISTTVTLISAGTERMLVDFGKSSMLEKARRQPDRVKEVIGKIKTDGLMPTVEAVRSKLSQPIPLGYCNVGKIIAVGKEVRGFSVGDRVASNGAHADVVRVPQNLCAKVPDTVCDEDAAFVVAASIGLQGIRLAQPTLGECVVVTGAGLIGLLTIQLLLAQGCRVLAIDYDDGKLELARSFGAEICNPGNGESPVLAGMAFSRGRGADAVIITASTDSSDPVTQAAQMSRKRGRIVLVGVAGLDLNRADFYEKELSFQVSCSYGPGRYDPEYEAKGNDYPLAYVRWTEGRNFEAVLDLMKNGKLPVKQLVSSRYDFELADSAYNELLVNKSSLGIILHYKSSAEERLSPVVELNPHQTFNVGALAIGVIGAGNYASRILIPAFKSTNVQLKTIVSSGGLSGVVSGKKVGFTNASSTPETIFSDGAISVVVIATRHDSHANLTCQALDAGKHVFVEKPLALTSSEVDAVEQSYNNAHSKGSGPQLMVGYNRRYAPQIRKMKELIDSVTEPKSFLMVMNAGSIPAIHWTQDKVVGGGRIIGEACHFIDLMRHLAGQKVTSVSARRMGDNDSVGLTEDKASITLGFADGSFGTIMYLANGASDFPKERVEVFAAGKTLQLDNFRQLKGFGWNNFGSMNLRRQDKGQRECPLRFIEGIKSGKPTIPPEEIFEVARVTIEAAEVLRNQ